MKNKKFTALLLVTMLLLSCVVTGCGKSITPKECAQIWWEISFNEISNVSKLNISEDEAKAKLKESDEKNVKTLKNAYIAQGLVVTDEQMKELYDASNELAKRATVTIEEVSNDGKTAQVKYKTTYVDITKLGTKAANDAIDSIKTLGITNQKEAIDKYSELIIKNLVNEIKNATFGEDTKELTYTFTKKDKVWVPEDQEALGQKLGSLVSGQAQ